MEKRNADFSKIPIRHTDVSQIQGDQGSMLWSQFSAIFDNFRQKMAFFSKTNVTIKIFHNLALFWVKNANFLLNFSAKTFKNHNIGPRLGEFSPNGWLFTLESFFKITKVQKNVGATFVHEKSIV
jgi:hypothetical protein